MFCCCFGFAVFVIVFVFWAIRQLLRAIDDLLPAKHHIHRAREHQTPHRLHHTTLTHTDSANHIHSLNFLLLQHFHSRHPKRGQMKHTVHSLTRSKHQLLVTDVAYKNTHTHTHTHTHTGGYQLCFCCCCCCCCCLCSPVICSTFLSCW